MCIPSKNTLTHKAATVAIIRCVGIFCLTYLYLLMFIYWCMYIADWRSTNVNMPIILLSAIVDKFDFNKKYSRLFSISEFKKIFISTFIFDCGLQFILLMIGTEWNFSRINLDVYEVLTISFSHAFIIFICFFPWSHLDAKKDLEKPK